MTAVIYQVKPDKLPGINIDQETMRIQNKHTIMERQLGQSIIGWHSQAGDLILGRILNPFCIDLVDPERIDQDGAATIAGTVSAR